MALSYDTGRKLEAAKKNGFEVSGEDDELTSYISEGGREDYGKNDKKDGDAPPGASAAEILFVEMAGTRLWISILMQIVPHGQKGGV